MLETWSRKLETDDDLQTLFSHAQSWIQEIVDGEIDWKTATDEIKKLLLGLPDEKIDMVVLLGSYAALLTKIRTKEHVPCWCCVWYSAICLGEVEFCPASEYCSHFGSTLMPDMARDIVLSFCEEEGFPNVWEWIPTEDDLKERQQE